MLDMSNKLIQVDLSESGIDEAIRKLEEYKKSIDYKAEKLRNKIANLIAKQAQSGFDNAILSDLTNKPSKNADVSVQVSNQGDITLVIANGEDAVWVEFGSGVSHNTPVGNSPHPKGQELGFTIGSYGKGKGKQKVWTYYDENGSKTITRGTPSKMPMYKALTDILDDIATIAKEVFND